MIRKLLTMVLPLLLPFIVYGIYVVLTRRHLQRSGAGQPIPRWEEWPWLWLIIAGLILMVGALVAFRLTSGLEPGAEFGTPTVGDDWTAPGMPVE